MRIQYNPDRFRGIESTPHLDERLGEVGHAKVNRRRGPAQSIGYSDHTNASVANQPTKNAN